MQDQNPKAIDVDLLDPRIQDASTAIFRIVGAPDDPELHEDRDKLVEAMALAILTAVSLATFLRADPDRVRGLFDAAYQAHLLRQIEALTEELAEAENEAD